MRLRRSSSRMRDSGRHLKSLRQPRLRRPTSSRPRARATCPAPQPDGSRPCMCAFRPCSRPCALCVRRSQNSMRCSTMSKRRASMPCPLARIRTSQNGAVTSAYSAASVRRGFLVVPIRRMELAVRPDEVQRASLRALQDAIAQAGELLKTDCPTYRPITPVVRIDAMEQRLDTMLRAINIVQPALQKFYGSLTDEQKERFNRLAPVQG